jgi:hypothetical protein
MGHKTTWKSCEFVNKGRTSILDVMISTFQLTIGINMTQVNPPPPFCTTPYQDETESTLRKNPFTDGLANANFPIIETYRKVSNKINFSGNVNVLQLKHYFKNWVI